MPPSHPRPEDLTALGAAMSSTADDAAACGDQLLDHLVTVGDHASQIALDGFVDEAVDILRELSAGCRELALTLRSGAASAPVGDAADLPARQLP